MHEFMIIAFYFTKVNNIKQLHKLIPELYIYIDIYDNI